MHCFYEISHGTGGTKYSNQETITSGNVVAEFYCTKPAQGFRESNTVRAHVNTWL